MKVKYTISKRLLAMVLCLAMVLTYLPQMAFPATAAGADARIADESTMGLWEYFMQSHTAGVDLTTEYAGGIWTDKSVFPANSIPGELTNAVSLENTHLSVEDTGDNFLVALSAIASNKEIVGYSTIPTDTVFVLDLSSSMESNDASRGSAIDELVDATNSAITDLLELNKNNRIAVVLYAGNTSGQFNENPGATTVIMPLDSYSAPKGAGGVRTFLESTTDSDRRADHAVKVAANVVNSDNQSVGQTKMDTSSGTFMQDGIYEAMRVFLGVTDTKIQSGVQAGTTRLPIMVLMTDGEPTMASSDYNGNAAMTDLGTSDVHLRFNNQDYNHRDTIAFLTQLTAAFAKREISQHYENNALFYTLAFGEEVNSLDEALSVMNPEQTSSTLNGFWNDFLAGQEVRVFTTQTGYRPVSYQYTTVKNDTAEPLVAADKLYVDEFYPATSVAGLEQAFRDIVAEIVIQSKYYPTYVERDHDHDGYITFTDKIGGYMDVKSVKGFVVGDHYFSGATLSKGFQPGSNIFGTIQNPNAYGDTLVASVKARLGIENTATAQALLQDAFEAGQLSYTDDTHFSNYIGWYSDANGNYLDFWYEGADLSQAPANATHIVMSYGFLGETDAVHGISNTDMLFASVRVSKELVDFDGDGITGETMLLWQLPASLIPTITYEVDVEVDSQGNITNVIDVALENANVKPIRLLYEVGLRAGIHDWNVAQTVDPGYVASTTNKDAGYVFYTNQWKKGGTVQDATSTDRNTYSHYEPSLENERYYYTEDTPICTDESGTLYASSAKPSANGTYYRAFKVFEKLSNGTFRMHTHYERISSAALEQAVQVGGQWVIPKGVIHRSLEGFTIPKGNSNKTATMEYSFFPSIEDATNTYYAYSTLGNNGKLVYNPATGIRVTKTLEEVIQGATDEFTFTLSTTAPVTLVRLDQTGDEASRQSLTPNGGQVQFTLKAEETVYILDLVPGTVYTLAEKAHDTYKLVDALLNGQSAGSALVFTAQDQTIQTAQFVNGPVGYGNLYITKEIVSDHDIPANILAETFEVSVHVGTELTGQTYDVAYMDAAGAVQTVDGTVDATGYLKVNGQNLQLPADVTYEIIGLPEGTQVTVTELLSGAQTYYNTQIKTRDYSGANQDNDGFTTIYANSNSTAVITNTYTPAPVTVSLNVNGEKRFDIEAALTQDVTFNFELQQWDGNTWQPIKTSSVTYAAGTAAGNGAVRTFAIEALKNETFRKVGSYAYQVVEKIPDSRFENVIYDRTTYTFTVNVTDAGGQLVATIKDYADNTLTGTYDVSFHNTHHVAPVSVDIQKNITDTTNNPAITPAGFSFTATEADANWTPSADPAKTTTQVTDGAGQIRFAGTYRNTGVYRYILKEVIPAGATLITDGTYAGKYLYEGWYYDATVYYVAITVSQDPASGDLVAVVQTATDPNAVFSGTADSATLSFSNIYDPQDAKVDLNVVPAVLKNLEGRAPQAGEFTFYVVKDGTSWQNPANILATGTNDAQGKVTFDKTLTFDQIGEYKFDVVEKPGQPGVGVTYDPTVYDLVVEVSDGGDGSLKAVYYFEDSTTEQVTFHNIYTIADGQLIVEGEKKLTGRELLNGEFHFALQQVTDATGTQNTPGTLPVIAQNNPDHDKDGDASFAFPALIYTAEDAGKTFYYKVYEPLGGQKVNGVTHDSTVYILEVTVEDNGDGTLKITDTILGSANALNFENVYTPASVKVDLTGLKVLEGKDLAGYTFEFTMIKTDRSYAPLSGETAKKAYNDANGIFAFETLEFSTTGDYFYLIQETAGQAGGITYDTAKYYVHIQVTDPGQGKLVATTTITKVVENVELDVSSVVFQNTYSVTEGAQLQLSGTKTLDVVRGELALTDDLFTFVIMKDGTEVGRTTNKGNTITFPVLSYTPDQVGQTFTYTIEELNTGLAGVTYSQEKYTLVVTLTDRAGAVVASYELTDSAGNPVELTALNFVNTYEAETTNAVIAGTKNLTGRDPAKGEFAFQLFDEGGKLLQTVTNDGKGFTFEAIPYSQTGTYRYTVRELIPANAVENLYKGVKYDPAVYTVTVTVTDEGGQLKATVSHTASQLVFNNQYLGERISVPVALSKTVKVLSGKGVTAEGFRFLLADSQGNQVAILTTDAQGKAAGNLVFTDKDAGNVFTYTLTEINTQVPGVTYSTEKYTVTVTVDYVSDVLTATAVVTDAAGKTVDAVTFVNEYAAAPTQATIQGTKTLTGRDLAEGEFSFQLFDAQGKLLETVKNSANGFAFQAIPYDAEGTYTYTVKELIPENAKNNVYKGVTYDAKTYSVTVTVSDVGGKLEATVSCDASQLVFRNTYTPEEVEVTLDITKVVKINSGDGVSPAGFKFQLTDEAGNPMGQLTSNEDGKAAGVLRFTDAQEGNTYTYILSEVNTKVKGVTYSSAKYVIQITVVRDDQGKLGTAVTLDGQQTDQLAVTFVNTYDMSETPETGDSFRPGLILAAMAACAVGLVVLLLKKKELLA